MRYINLRFTYLLTYLLNMSSGNCAQCTSWQRPCSYIKSYYERDSVLFLMLILRA